MTPDVPNHDLVRIYEEAARAYYRSLPVEDTIDPARQGHSRKITLASFSLIREMRRDVQCFNELMIEYPTSATDITGRVVPNHFVVIHSEPIKAYATYDISRQPTRPVLAIEYVTEYRRKEFEENAGTFERDLCIPYYLRVYPHDAKLTLFHLVDGRYCPVESNKAGRYAIPELELEAGLLEGWVRYWFRGEFVPLPGDLLRQVTAARSELAAAKTELTAERKAREAVKAELTQMREELAKAKKQQP
jgi:hypothetical protein